MLICVAKMEVSVVGMDPSALTMTFRDVIVSYRDVSANITYYLQVNRADNATVMATEVRIIYFALNNFLFKFILIEHRQCHHFSNVNKPTDDNEQSTARQV